MKIPFQAAAAVTLFATQAVHAQTAVQWRVEDGGNGHWYAAITDAQPPTTLSGFVSYAANRGAVMASITSPMEEAFVISRIKAAGSAVGYIGLFRGADVQSWYWTDGSNSGFANWGGSNCYNGPYPNNPHWGGEFIGAVAYRPECGWKWDDTPASWLTNEGARIVLEWSADCNNDGIVDYGQILQGHLADTNADGVPDICQGPTCADADIYRDFNVNGADLGILLSQWGPNTPLTESDINRDGVVNGADLGLLLSFWGACP